MEIQIEKLLKYKIDQAIIKNILSFDKDKSDNEYNNDMNEIN